MPFHVVTSLETAKQTLPQGCVCALGMFDGVHIGHQQVLNQAVALAKQHGCPAVVLGFENHPNTLLNKTPPPMLSTRQERLAAFEALGIEVALMLPFTEAIRQLSPEQFIQTILLDTLGVKAVSIGYDYRYGKDRQGDGSQLTQAGTQQGFDVMITPPVTAPVVAGQDDTAPWVISSTVIRGVLSEGDITTANRLLGHPYILTGLVVPGRQQGQANGFATANLQIPEERLLPKQGVYGGWATVNQQSYPALCNIGVCPTYQKPETPQAPAPLQMEVHLLDYAGEPLYEQDFRFAFACRLRDEQRFESVEALVAQIQNDVSQFRQFLTQQNPKATKPTGPTALLV